MLEKFLHEEIMRSGLNDYLNMHMYSNAETKDLWDVFSKHANQSLEVKVYCHCLLSIHTFLSHSSHF